MNDKILHPIQDSVHSDALTVFEKALRSNRHISLEGGALPLALNANGGLYHGSFERGEYWSKGKLVPTEGYTIDTSAFEMTLRLACYALNNGAEVSLSLALWDVDGVPREQRKVVAERLTTNKAGEAIPDAYRQAAVAILGSDQQAKALFDHIQILPQSQYEQSIANRWRTVKKKIKKTSNIDAWAREHFERTGQIFLVTRKDDADFSFLSTLRTRQPFDQDQAEHPTKQVLSEGSLPMTIAGQTLCGVVSGGRINEMKKNARTNSRLANQNGVFTLNIQDTCIDAGSALKVARGIFFQDLAADGSADESIAYILGKTSSIKGCVIQLPKATIPMSFDKSLAVAKERIVTALHLNEPSIYGTLAKTPDRPMDVHGSSAPVRSGCSWNGCAL